MDESVNRGSQANTGNEAIPDWMLKRRARIQAAKEQIDRSTSTVEDTLDSDIGIADLPKESSENQAGETIVDLAAPRLPTPAVPVESLNRPATVGPVPATRAKARIIAKAKPILTGIQPEASAPQLEWHEQLKQRWLNKDALRSMGLSLGVHLTIGIILSFLVLSNSKPTAEPNTVFMTEGDTFQVGELDGTAIFQAEPPGGMSGDMELDTALPVNTASSVIGTMNLDTPDGLGGFKIGGTAGGGGGDGGDGQGEGGGIGDGLAVGGFQMPEGGKGVVKKGSFAAWTVPQDPEPGEDYKIIIQVKYKNRNQKMPAGDITGSVVGTDKYRLMISQHTSEIIPEAHQVVVHIPGAAARVRDTIRVYSAILRENQRLEIVF